jgi:MinD superfamily P-loop ATPase
VDLLIVVCLREKTDRLQRKLDSVPFFHDRTFIACGKCGAPACRYRAIPLAAIVNHKFSLLEHNRPSGLTLQPLAKSNSRR